MAKSEETYDETVLPLLNEEGQDGGQLQLDVESGPGDSVCLT